MAKSGSNSDDRTTEKTVNHGKARKSRSKKKVPSEARRKSEKVEGGKSRQSQGKIKAKSRQDQGKVKASSKQLSKARQRYTMEREGSTNVNAGQGNIEQARRPSEARQNHGKEGTAGRSEARF